MYSRELRRTLANITARALNACLQSMLKAAGISSFASLGDGADALETEFRRRKIIIVIYIYFNIEIKRYLERKPEQEKASADKRRGKGRDDDMRMSGRNLPRRGSRNNKEESSESSSLSDSNVVNDSENSESDSSKPKKKRAKKDDFKYLDDPKLPRPPSAVQSKGKSKK